MNHIPENNKIRLLLDLVLKLNDTFLQSAELKDVLNAVLVGITAGEGLGFNRAFLFKLNTESNCLEGSMAMGPSSPEEAERIWREINNRNLSLFDIMLDVKLKSRNEAVALKSLMDGISVSMDDTEHVFVAAIQGPKALYIKKYDETPLHGCVELCDAFGVEELAVVPLVTHQQPFGVVVADNFVTRRPITDSDLDALHLFAGLASIALCQANMCSLMEERIVDLQRLNSEVVRSRGLVIKAERYAALGKMADQLLHELRNPLSAIGGIAGMLSRRLAAEHDLTKYTDNIVQLCGRMERTLNEVFDLFNTPEVCQEKVRLYQLISASLEIFRYEMERLNISLELQLPEPEPVACVDRSYFQQALINVLKNAVEAMPDGGSLEVAVEHDDSNIIIKVTDSGLGIARGHLSRLDEPFFTTKSHAMGIGLSLGKRVMEQHGGTLYIEQNDKGGATVTLSLPQGSSVD